MFLSNYKAAIHSNITNKNGNTTSEVDLRGGKSIEVWIKGLL